MANKFLLVPQEIYHGLTASSSSGNQNLDFARRQLDSVKTKRINSTAKNILYKQALQRYLKLLRDYENKPVKVIMQDGKVVARNAAPDATIISGPGNPHNDDGWMQPDEFSQQGSPTPVPTPPPPPPPPQFPTTPAAPPPPPPPPPPSPPVPSPPPGPSRRGRRSTKRKTRENDNGDNKHAKTDSNAASPIALPKQRRKERRRQQLHQKRYTSPDRADDAAPHIASALNADNAVPDVVNEALNAPLVEASRGNSKRRKQQRPGRQIPRTMNEVYRIPRPAAPMVNASLNAPLVEGGEEVVRMPTGRLKGGKKHQRRRIKGIRGTLAPSLETQAGPSTSHGVAAAIPIANRPWRPVQRYSMSVRGRKRVPPSSLHPQAFALAKRARPGESKQRRRREPISPPPTKAFRPSLWL